VSQAVTDKAYPLVLRAWRMLEAREPQMAEPIQKDRLPVTLAERFDRYRVEVQQIVVRAIEHPRYELKRFVTISRENLADRLDFIKLVQGLANAHITEERFIVIGADQREGKFHQIDNSSEFDPATLSQIISKYLYPQPRLEVFNNIRADGGESYVLIVLNPDQPRPIVTVTEGKSDKRIHFGIGEIWIKKDTRLQLATRADLDEMYEAYIKRRVDEEAETRARRRFEHFRETFGPELTTRPTVSVPGAELMIGAKGRLAKFAEDAISTGNATNFKMFLEMVRERLVEKWDSLDSEGPGGHFDIGIWTTKREEIYRDEFAPALDSAVELGLLVIKYDASTEWLNLITNGLVEAFEACRNLDKAKAIFIGQVPGPVSFARPAYDAYVGIRTLATYAVMRQRFRFLKEIFHKYVRFLTPEGSSQVYVPIIFWPFSGVAGLPDMRHGRNAALWNEHIHSAWGDYFGSFEKFLAVASQLEFILEFNSYIFEGVRVPEVKKFQQSLENKYFAYLPDFWANRLDPVVPVAEQLYDALVAGSDFPDELLIEKRAGDLIFKGKDVQDRLLFLGGFLAHLKSSQAQMMMQQNRFPFMFSWEGRLKAIVDKYEQVTKKK
jgi:hypothetical protein